MLSWCAFCQQFQGEILPYEDFSLSHGICPDCNGKGLDLTEDELGKVRRLSEIQTKLMSAGKAEDFTLAEQLVNEAISKHVRPLDILMGLLTPLLYQIGEEWKKGTISVIQEHRFTSFCERLFDLIDARIPKGPPQNELIDPPPALLMNVRGNYHTLAIRILALWFRSKGIAAKVIYPSPTPEILLALVRMLRPKFLLVSVALAEQLPGAITVAEAIGTLPAEIRPKIFMGGQAIKLGLISSIPGAEMLTDISSLAKLASSLSKKILLVDDQAPLREVIWKVLKKEGYVVLVAEDGAHAQQIVENEELDLILTDVWMPRGSGIDLLHFAKKLKPLLPVVLMTGASELTESDAASKAGADGLLSKPFAARELLALLSSLLVPLPRH